ncbi:hypothetical protein JCM19238_1730 [Vibrio ponticus]|nr:hypothetical protein JCM19238_1730 [Vibrio ponticus]
MNIYSLLNQENPLKNGQKITIKDKLLRLIPLFKPNIK